MVTFSNSEIDNDRELNNIHTYKEPNPKLFDVVLLGSVYKNNSREFERSLSSRNYNKVALNLKEHYSSENQFRKPNEDKRKNHYFCSFWNTYRKKENCHQYSRNRN